MKNDYLEHYGVLNMRWGVRNAETLARYARDGRGPKIKRAMSSVGKGAKKAAVTTGKGIKKAAVTTGRAVISPGKKAYNKRKERKESYERMTDVEKLEYNRSKMSKRQASKDMREAVNRRSTMSDDELNARIIRLQNEIKLKNLTKEATAVEKNKANPYLKKAMDKVVDKTVDRVTQEALDAVFPKKKKKDKQ